MITAELIRRGAERYADRTALVYVDGVNADRALTYREVNDASNQIANVLIARGIAKGQRVALLIGNGPWSVSVDFACVKAGVTRVPLNGRLSLAEHQHMLEETESTVLIHDEALTGRAEELLSHLPQITALGLGAPAAGGGDDLLEVIADVPADDPRVPLDPSDPLMWLYTSGTTGKLKAVEHTQGSYAGIVANILANLVSPGLSSSMLHAASLVHASGTFVVPYWLRGGLSVVLPGFDPKLYVATIEKYKITEVNLVPTMIGMLFTTGVLDGADTTSLDTIVYGASPMPRPVLQNAIDHWGPKLVQYYGQTEAPLCMTVLDKDDHADPALWASCGHPTVDAEIELTDDDGNVVPDGEIGEIRVRAPFGMSGYTNAPELNAEMLAPGGWIRTRDMARRDGRGYLYLVDRRSDMIVTGGYNVYPREVEDVLLTHPAVAEAAVVGAPDEKWVEAVTAFVTLKPGSEATEAELQQLVAGELARYKIPKSVTFVDDIPKSAVGKILRRALRDPLWANEEGQK
ncbi:acyl-CoA synthetase (AMP-forming)/AMP-acid ligase II [Antricoccus suffuscus]|uniref:Acyl-CoA synthetase (AMP-forming)/AMP-acid ligase II n=1 Tax=Antricoccus suffuscus TaxID=1629062 RepID=A0A2T1A6Q9_9ACTN|nr:AMP-binding protein [Antricoccus suffuscus]PRZ44302.1 acyl-CoA synthetase (AMP-forming)/AMP-acid ligase II [Antricoccus suffuscus]